MADTTDRIDRPVTADAGRDAATESLAQKLDRLNAGARAAQNKPRGRPNRRQRNAARKHTPPEQASAFLHACATCKRERGQGAYSPMQHTRIVAKEPAECRHCESFNRFLTKSGLKRADFEAMRAAQNNECGVCGVEFTDDVRAHIDMPAGTEKYMRGLLCPVCLRGVLQLGDNLAGSLRASIYLANAAFTRANDKERLACEGVTVLLREAANIVDSLNGQGTVAGLMALRKEGD